jgi:hypothetical protein
LLEYFRIAASAWVRPVHAFDELRDEEISPGASAAYGGLCALSAAAVVGRAPVSVEFPHSTENAQLRLRLGKAEKVQTVTRDGEADVVVAMPAGAEPPAPIPAKSPMEFPNADKFGR